jgi:hypothetical protein
MHRTFTVGAPASLAPWSIRGSPARSGPFQKASYSGGKAGERGKGLWSLWPPGGAALVGALLILVERPELLRTGLPLSSAGPLLRGNGLGPRCFCTRVRSASI